MKHFADYLQRAIRQNTSSVTPSSPPQSSSTSCRMDNAPNADIATSAAADVDWSSYYVDYPMLKSRLSSYTKRRLKLSEVVQDGDRVYLTEEDLRLVVAMGSTEHDADVDANVLLMMMDSKGSSGIADEIATRMAACGRCDDYFEYVDGGENDQPSFRVDPVEATARLSRIERANFSCLLDKELERVASFYSTQLVNLARSINALADSEDDAAETNSALRFAEMRQQYEHVGNEILELLAFVVTNIICLRQILIRYDAFVRTFDGQPLSQWYLHEKVGSSGVPCDHISSLFHLEALWSLEDSFIGQMKKAHGLHSGRMQDVHATLLGEGSGSIDAIERGSTDVETAATPSTMKYLDDFSKQAGLFRQLMDKTSVSVIRAAGGNIVMRDQLVNGMRTVRYYFMLGSGLHSLRLEPSLLLMRGRHLKEEIRSVARWREERDLITEEEEETEQKLDPENVLPLLLNLIACFLYMMNNYIIEPSSAYYAESLGSNDAMSGMMIGMTPWFALVSSVGYSIWTNHSYRQPMIFACALTFAGNLLYASAGSFHSMPVCLIGRALTGLGATRIINRRYIADATPFAFRTAASAAFSLVTALGAAMGPALAVLLDYFDFEFYLPILGKQEFNGMTGPGFFMALMWLLFTICTAIVFNEPSRSGLEELRMRESNAALLNDSTATEDTVSIDSSTEMKPEERGNPVTHCFRNITKPVLLTMSLIFMKRIALESIVGSTSVVTKNRYGWSIKNVGTLHFVNGMIVIPISIISGWLSQFYKDRYLALCLMCVTLSGMLCLIDMTDFVSRETDTYNEGHPLAVGPTRYIAGSLVAFSGIEACESFVASLMSKLVPSALAVGTFNSGLLTTLVGTSGRASGDLLITVLGSWSIRNLLNLLIIPSTGLVITSILLVLRNYDDLAV
mmetsp:Transcript_15461/g.34523  ORF Transcript_15461/g.34523 Transcript_15461/m.34523 type:complete len:909 (+) Transcript_15461:277-3003(+)